MNWTVAIIGIIVSGYLGTVGGIYSLCVETPRLYKAKRYVFYIPAFTVIFIVCGIFSNKKDYRTTVIKFLKMPHKCVIVLSFFAEVVAVEKEKRPKKIPPKKIIFNGVASLLHTVFQGNKYSYYLK